MNQEKIGKFISEKRKDKKLTQSELAEKLGVTDKSISNWENGRNMPDLSLFKPICEILDISIVKKVEYDEETNTYKEEEEEIDEEEKARLFEEKKCQRNEFLHLMDQLTDLVTVLSKANLFKRCLLHCIQAISSKSKLTKTKVFLEFPFYV